ncbi:Hypothetical predicted protein [Olea europaea subsp. europaea]|uniref:Uncharacterized protein n=1 Tax=Olea europaea subsp. europaea TaxID=158383 RepID=A0A8S0T647_OLEEU|nr:Hypothetical predicted protein [Olea europaea subsp. europaea]
MELSMIGVFVDYSGHGSFSKNLNLNNIVGHILHSSILVPYHGCGGMNGYVYLSDKPICPAVISSPSCDMEMIMENKVTSVFYKFPPFHPHMPKPPDGVIMPGKAHATHVFSGPRLAILAHQLVSGNYVSKQCEDMDGKGGDNGKLGKRKCHAPDENKKKKKNKKKKHQHHNKSRKLNRS